MCHCLSLRCPYVQVCLHHLLGYGVVLVTNSRKRVQGQLLARCTRAPQSTVQRPKVLQEGHGTWHAQQHSRYVSHTAVWWCRHVGCTRARHIHGCAAMPSTRGCSSGTLKQCGLAGRGTGLAAKASHANLAHAQASSQPGLIMPKPLPQLQLCLGLILAFHTSQTFFFKKCWLCEAAALGPLGPLHPPTPGTHTHSPTHSPTHRPASHPPSHPASQLTRPPFLNLQEQVRKGQEHVKICCFSECSESPPPTLLPLKVRHSGCCMQLLKVTMDGCPPPRTTQPSSPPPLLTFMRPWLLSMSTTWG